MNSTNMARSKEVRLICWKRCQHTSHDAVEYVKDDAENGEMKDLMAKMVLAQKMASRVGARGEVESETTPPISQGRLA